MPPDSGNGSWNAGIALAPLLYYFPQVSCLPRCMPRLPCGEPFNEGSCLQLRRSQAGPGRLAKVGTDKEHVYTAICTASRPLNRQALAVHAFVFTEPSVYWSNVQMDALLSLLAAMLLERRIIVVASDRERVTSAVHAAAAMLYPFRWQHIYLPLLPTALRVSQHLTHEAARQGPAGALLRPV